jgi:NADPH:quinone reductase-like Zn-dependent oxidoreductase
VLDVDSIDRPEPRANEVLVEARAIGVNPTEVYSRTGVRDHKLPRVPGADVAGTVASVGDLVNEYAPGDRVFATGLQNDRQGSYAEFVPVRADRIAHLPPEVTYQGGGAAGVVVATAWLAFTKHAGLAPTSTCLIHGGSGGVGHVAVQLAKAFGATVLTTAGTEESREFAARCGGDEIFDYRNDGLEAAVTDATADGVDVVLDHRVGDYLQFDLDVLALDGTVVVIGGPNDDARLTDLWEALRSDATIQVFSMSNEPDLGDVLESVARLMADERIQVHVSRRYDLEDADDAQRAVIEESVHGKIVVVP